MAHLLLAKEGANPAPRFRVSERHFDAVRRGACLGKAFEGGEGRNGPQRTSRGRESRQRMSRTRREESQPRERLLAQTSAGPRERNDGCVVGFDVPRSSHM